MCGGVGSRMNAEVEKPLLQLAGKTFIERVLLALKGSGKFSRIVAVVSPNTPKTRQFALSKGTEVIDTAGHGYSDDLSFLLSKLAPERVFVVPADMPLLTPRIVSDIVEVLQPAYPAVSIVIEKKFAEELGVKPSVPLESGYCHSGISVFDTRRIADYMEERYIKMNIPEIAVNVNTKEEKELAERLLIQRS
jgi:adenosylcobinamide-phosphate guanylyltransferase